MQRISLITGVERRRRFTVDEKVAIVKEAFSSGSSVKSVAKKYEIGTTQLYNWRRALGLAKPSRSQVLETGDFVQLAPAPHSGYSFPEKPSTIKIHFNSTLILELPANIELSRIAPIIRAIQGGLT
jgi:transposase